MASISSRAVQAVEKARATAHSWNRVAMFLQANPDIANLAYHYPAYVLVSLATVDDPAATIADYASRAAQAGARIEADISDEYSGLKAWVGSVVYINFYARSEHVCEVAPVVTPSLVGPLAALVAEGSAA